jgi:hypothetical protein
VVTPGLYRLPASRADRCAMKPGPSRGLPRFPGRVVSKTRRLMAPLTALFGMVGSVLVRTAPSYGQGVSAQLHRCRWANSGVCPEAVFSANDFVWFCGNHSLI